MKPSVLAIPLAVLAIAVKILAPQPGARLAQDFIHVEYELINAGSVPGTPTFKVQLDNQAAVQTTDQSKEFTGLTPGIHNLSVWVVDANGTPVSGSQATVQFILLAPAPGSTANASELPDLLAAPERSLDLPEGGSPLPLLSIIGFGVLAGGLISAMRTR